MPKILINEKDRTSPGTPGGYSNYSVLLVGFADSTKEKPVDAKKPDSNGVYEFSSAQSFKDTIGLMEPRQTAASTGTTIYHYGNQMAYELLNMGYSIIYKPISKLLFGY